MVWLRTNIVENRVNFWQKLLGVIKALTRKTASYLITMLLFLGYFLSFAVTLGPLHVLWQVSFGFWVTWSISSWQKYYKSVFFPKLNDEWWNFFFCLSELVHYKLWFWQATEALKIQKFSLDKYLCWFLCKNFSNFVPPNLKTPQPLLPYLILIEPKTRYFAGWLPLYINPLAPIFFFKNEMVLAPLPIL